MPYQRILAGVFAFAILYGLASRHLPYQSNLQVKPTPYPIESPVNVLAAMEGKDQLHDWKTFKYESLGYSVEVPKHFEITDNGPGSIRFSDSAVPESDRGIIYGYISVSRPDAAETPVTVFRTELLTWASAHKDNAGFSGSPAIPAGYVETGSIQAAFGEFVTYRHHHPEGFPEGTVEVVYISRTGRLVIGGFLNDSVPNGQAETTLAAIAGSLKLLE